DDADLAWGDTGGRQEHARALRPEVAEALLPHANDLLRGDVGSLEPDAEPLVPELTESLRRAGHAAAGDVRAGRPRRDLFDVERPDRLGPVRLVVVLAISILLNAARARSTRSGRSP